jgi:hypothetical protein
MASSAISRWLQWLMGRSLSDGFSHVIATRDLLGRERRRRPRALHIGQLLGDRLPVRCLRRAAVIQAGEP